MIRLLICHVFRFHVSPRGWNPDFSSGYRCPCCGKFVQGKLR